MAVTLTSSNWEEAFSSSDTRHPNTREIIKAVVTAEVEAYAPAAPSEYHNLAALRWAGFLAREQVGARIGAGSYISVVDMAASFRRSGAALILNRYRIRRAGKIEAAD